MADVFPSSLIYRENPNLRLGIKSSLNSFKQLLASLYIIYKSCANPSKVLFSEEVNVGDNIAICLSKKLLVRINELFPQLPNLQDRINQSPLFKSQCESLQVGLELFLHLGKIDFVENGKQERKGKDRIHQNRRRGQGPRRGGVQAEACRGKRHGVFHRQADVCHFRR